MLQCACQMSSSDSENQLASIQHATQLAAQQHQQQQALETPLPPSPSQQANSGDMTYATVQSSEDFHDSAPAPAKQAAVAKKPAPSAAAKKQALAKKRQREVSTAIS